MAELTNQIIDNEEHEHTEWPLLPDVTDPLVNDNIPSVDWLFFTDAAVLSIQPSQNVLSSGW